MNPNEKKELLKSLNEKEFRQDLIIPLLSKMGYIAPIEYHGTSERGKDIICFEYDKLNEQRFLSIVAKTGKLTGNVSTDTGLMTVVNQIEQSFDNPYEDLYNMKQVLINEVWVMTTGKIVSGAEESVIKTLRKRNLDKRIRFISDDRLVQLIDRHFSTYWNSTTETKESVIIQRDRLLHFIETLLIANNVDKSTIKEVKSSILYSNYNTRIKKDFEGLNFSSLSSYSIELSKIDEDFNDYIFSKSYGITKDIFAKAKKHLSYSFFDIEETIEHANRISKITNPEDFYLESESYLTRSEHFQKARGDDASKFMDELSYLEEGLNDLKLFKSYLKHKGKLEWAKELSKSIIELLPEIEKIIENSEEDEIIINYSISEENKIVKIEYDNKNSSICFTNKFKRIEDVSNEGHFKPSHYKHRNSDGTIKSAKVIDNALCSFREYAEKLLDYNETEWLKVHIEN